MKTEKQGLRTFGELVVAVYDTFGKRRARGIICLFVNGGVVEFRGRRRFVFSEL